MHLAVMSAAKRNRKLVADLAVECRYLRKPQVVSISGASAANQTGLLGNRCNVLAVRTRRGAGRANMLLSTKEVRRFLLRPGQGSFIDAAAAAVMLTSRSWKACSTCSASTAAKVFLAPITRCAQFAASSGE